MLLHRNCKSSGIATVEGVLDSWSMDNRVADVFRNTSKGSTRALRKGKAPLRVLTVRFLFSFMGFLESRRDACYHLEHIVHFIPESS